MSQSLEDDNSTQPTMQQVPGIKGHAQQRNQWVIPTSHKHQSHQVDGGHGSRPVAHHTRDGMLILAIGKSDRAADNVHHDNTQNEKGVKATGQCAEVDGAGQLHLLVMAVAEQGCIDHMVLDLGKRVMGRQEVPLTVIGEAGQSTQMSVEPMRHLPDVDDGCH